MGLDMVNVCSKKQKKKDSPGKWMIIAIGRRRRKKKGLTNEK